MTNFPSVSPGSFDAFAGQGNLGLSQAGGSGRIPHEVADDTDRQDLGLPPRSSDVAPPPPITPTSTAGLPGVSTPPAARSEFAATTNELSQQLEAVPRPHMPPEGQSIQDEAKILSDWAASGVPLDMEFNLRLLNFQKRLQEHCFRIELISKTVSSATDSTRNVLQSQV